MGKNFLGEIYQNLFHYKSKNRSILKERYKITFNEKVLKNVLSLFGVSGSFKLLNTSHLCVKYTNISIFSILGDIKIVIVI